MLFQKLLCILIIGDVQIVPVVQTGTLEFLSSMENPIGPTRCRRAPVQAQVRAILPVFWGNLRLKQHDIQPRLMWFQDIPSLKSSSEYDM